MDDYKSEGYPDFFRLSRLEELPPGCKGDV